jgi:H+/Cl- antiporter ClcA
MGIPNSAQNGMNSKDGAQRNSNPSPPAQFRIVLVSFLAAAIGLVAGLVAYVLYKLIGLFTNLFFFHRWAADFTSVRYHHLGPWVILVPVIGGLIVGVMAKYGTSKIKGHGIPEAMEAVLTNRSRIAPRVALLKPISAAIAIGTGGPFGAEGPIIQTGGDRIAGGTGAAYNGGRTESAAGVRRGGWNVGDVQHSDCGSDSCH